MPTPANPRRLHAPSLRIGAVALDAVQAHHARQVLRLPDGTAVELFDDAGNTAAGVLRYPDDGQAVVAVETIRPPHKTGMAWTVASAVPKAERADWLVEKLSELGASRWIPLAAERSVVLPSGTGKRQRWMRIATESAKQSRRAGVMTIDELTPLEAAIAAATAGGDSVRSEDQCPGCTSGAAMSWVLSPAPDAIPIAKVIMQPPPAALTLFVGPEGGWTDSERRQFADAGISAVRLGPTILRIETAAVAATALVAAMWA